MSKKAFDTSLEGKLIKKINELYITNRKSFLVLDKDGKYTTVTNTLHDGHIASHLRGNQTIGIFSGAEVSKFVCFDIDMSDKSKLRWIYYLLMKTLVEIGLNEDYIHVANSGNKGLHILLFVENGTSINHFKHLFIKVMESIQEKLDGSIETHLFNSKELKLEIKGVAFIEFRCTETQGLKLELGINFKNKDNKTNKCVFVDKETLKNVNRDDYLLWINPIPKDKFLELMNTFYDNTEAKINENKELIKQTITEPYSHKINKDESETIQYIINLIENGLCMTGSRNNAVFKIAKYFRYMGMDLESCIEELQWWMRKQEKKYYSISLEDALSECERISRNVYEKEYNLVGHIENLYIYKSEIKRIMSIKEKNTKIIFFAMLLHSKRYSLKNGVFYMTFNQIEEMTKLGRKAATNNIKELEEKGLLEVVERNIKQEHTHIKKPNKYRIKLDVEEIENDIALEIDNTSSNINYLNMYYDLTVKLFTDKELRKLSIPKYQYDEFKKYRKLIS